MTNRICAKSQEGRKTTLLPDPPGRGGSGRHGQRLLALAIVQEAGEAGDLPAGEAGEAGDPGQVGGDGRAPLTSPHQDSHTGPGQPELNFKYCILRYSTT